MAAALAVPYSHCEVPRQEGDLQPTMTSALLQRRPELARVLGGLFIPAPHRFAGPVTGTGLSLEVLSRCTEGIDWQFLPSELQRTVGKRRLDYLAGRLCAEQALCRLGCSDCAIRRLPSGEPYWPAGFVGSITHTDAVAYAVVAVRDGEFGIGIDSEGVLAADSVVAVSQVCCSAEEMALVPPGQDAEALVATLIFSAKESVYKATYPVVRQVVEFSAVEVAAIDWHAKRLRIRARANGDAGVLVPHCYANFEICDNIVHTAVAFDRTVSGMSA